MPLGSIDENSSSIAIRGRKKIKFETITDEKIIEDVLLRRNKLHFSQASDTPLAINKILDELGFSGSTATAKQILERTTTIEDIVDDEASWELLRSFQRKEAAVKVDFDSDDIIQGYRSWSEKKTTSPSGRHLGHFHALFRPFKFDNEAELEEITNL